MFSVCLLLVYRNASDFWVFTVSGCFAECVYKLWFYGRVFKVFHVLNHMIYKQGFFNFFLPTGILFILSSLVLLLKLRLKALYWAGLDQVNILALFLSFYSFNTILAVGLLHIALSVEIGSLCL